MKNIKLPEIEKTYLNYIGGEWVKSSSQKTFDSVNPATGKVLAQFQRGNAEDINIAVEVAEKAFVHWSRTSGVARSEILNKIADVIDQNKEFFATLETLDNGKPIRETLAADIPLASDHFRYFASVLRTEENTSA